MSITEAKEDTRGRGREDNKPKMDGALSSDRHHHRRGGGSSRSRSRSRSRGRDNHHHRHGRHWNDDHYNDRQRSNNRGRYEDDRYGRDRSRDHRYYEHDGRRDERYDNHGGYYRNDDDSNNNNYHQRGGEYGNNNHDHGPPHAARNDYRNNSNHHNQLPAAAAAPATHKMPTYKIKATPPDPNLDQLNDDPRGTDPTQRITKTAKRNGNGRNTESFDPASTLVRPALRVWVGSKSDKKFTKPLKHDDVVIIPELFGPESNWDIYYKLVSEMRTLQANNVKGSEWQSWHEGAHLISKNPVGSETFEMVIEKLCEYFSIRRKSVGTRFNWYRDSSDWKPFHHDSAAYNPKRAKDQNITVGVSFGARRELAFLHATPQQNGDKCKIYFPQTNNGVFSFGRDVNIQWKHGVNALSEEEQDGKGRISIVLWGLAENVIEEEGSPPLLGADGQGPHAQQKRDGHRGNRRRCNNNHHRGRR